MKKQGIGFKIERINTLQFATINSAPLNADKIEETIDFTFNSIKEDHIVNCLFGYTLYESKSPFIKIQVACSFQIVPKDFEQLLNSDVFRIPLGFARHLANITVGTTRGILHNKTEGTSYNAFPVGIIDIETILDEDIIIDFIEK